MIPVAAYFIVFGTIAEMLGLLAWFRVKSKPSLIAGVASGLVLTIAGLLALTGFPRAGLTMGGAASVLLMARFLPGFLRKRSIYPDGIMAGLSCVGVVLTALHWR